MNDVLIQQWLDGEKSGQPSELGLSTYQRLYKALAEAPEEQLPDGFAASVAARISRLENGRRLDFVIDVVALVMAALGFVLLVRYSAQFVALDLASIVHLLDYISVPSGLVSLTWFYTALVCMVLAWLDKHVATKIIH